jgi:hypothetical protein
MKKLLMGKFKEIIIKIYDKVIATRWDESWILPHYIKILFFINLYIVFINLFSGLLLWKICGFIMLITLFISKYCIIKYGRKYKKELKGEK